MRLMYELIRKGVVMSLLLVAVMSACLPEELAVSGLPKVKPKIVVSTQIIPDESLVVLLTKSFGALDASDDSDPETVLRQIAIADALVVISSELGSDTLLNLGLGAYGGVFLDLEPGIDYTLYVNSESMGQVEATTQVKPQVRFDEMIAQLYFDGYDDTLAQVSYRFNDPAERNYYMINAIKVDLNEFENNLLNPRDYIKLLRDDEFNGEPHSDTFLVLPTEFNVGDTLAVYLSNISKEYYDFMQLRLDNRFSFVEFISEPVNYPTNVKGGLGFFNLYVPDIRVVVFQE